MNSKLDIEAYNIHIGIDKPKNEYVQIGVYEPGNLRKKSPEVSIDHYRISIKVGFDTSQFNPEKPFSALLFITGPEIPFEWNVSKDWTGYYFAFSHEWLTRHNYLVRRIFNYSQQDALFVQKEDIEEINFIFKRLFDHEKRTGLGFCTLPIICPNTY